MKNESNGEVYMEGFYCGIHKELYGMKVKAYVDKPLGYIVKFENNTEFLVTGGWCNSFIVKEMKD